MQPPADAPDLHHGTTVPAPRAPETVPAPRTPETVAVPGTVAVPETVAVPGTAAVPVDAVAAPPEPGAAVAPAVLTDRDEQILAFERKWWKHAGSKEQAVRDTFGLSATRYYQLLNGLLDNPAALEHDPVLVARLRRLRSTRARTRRR